MRNLKTTYGRKLFQSSFFCSVNSAKKSDSINMIKVSRSCSNFTQSEATPTGRKLTTTTKKMFIVISLILFFLWFIQLCIHYVFWLSALNIISMNFFFNFWKVRDYEELVHFLRTFLKAPQKIYSRVVRFWAIL